MLFLFNILIWIIIGFLTINLALFIWRIITPFARMYYSNVNGKKSYFGYIWKNTKGKYEIIDSGKIIGNKSIGFVETTNDKAWVKLVRNNNTSGYNNCDSLGYVTRTGDIFDSKDVLIAKCDVTGYRSWRYLWLMHRTKVNLMNGNKKTEISVGHCTESLRFGHTKKSQISLLAKAAATLVLCEDYIIAEEDNRNEEGVGAKDLAFPASILYVIFFSVISMLMMYYQMFPALGEIISYVGGMLVVYLVIWWTLFMLKTDFANRNVSFSNTLNLINRNTGIRSWNVWLILLSVLGLLSSIIIHGYVFVPLFVVVLIGVIINVFTFSAAPWKILQPSSNLWQPKDPNDRKTNREKVKTITPGQQTTVTKTIVKRKFVWDLTNFNVNNDSNSDTIELQFYKEDFEDANPEIRKRNPFFGQTSSGTENWKTAVVNIEKSIKEVLKGSDSVVETSEKDALNTIINSASLMCNKYNLSDFELYELLLHFCQSEINYKKDEESTPINKAGEYVRFPAESLYDIEGDCDCKSALAYKLFDQLGVEVKFAIVNIKDGTRRHAGILIKKDTGKVKLPPKFKVNIPKHPDFAYCEATGVGWEIGVLPPDIDIDSIQVI